MIPVLEFLVPVKQPLLVDGRCHPGLCIACVVETKHGPVLFLIACGFQAFPMMSRDNSLDLSAFVMNKYVSQSFLPLTPDACLLDSPQSGGMLSSTIRSD